VQASVQLSPAAITALQRGTQQSWMQGLELLAKAKKYIAQAYRITPPFVSSPAAACASWMRAQCAVPANESTLVFPPAKGNTSMAAFLVARGPFAYIGAAKATIENGTSSDPLFRLHRLDTGKPTGACTEAPKGTFSRNWTKGKAVVDCTTAKGTLDFKMLKSDDTGAGVVSVSCVGDSITVADGNLSYPDQLGRLLGAGYYVTNRGVSGHTMLNSGLCGAGPGGSWRHRCLATPNATTYSCTGNCSYWATPQFQATLHSGADIITIMLGTNDAKFCNWFGPPNGVPAGAGTQFASDYVKMIKLFKALPSRPKVFVVLPPPAISQCPLTGPAGNASICLAYNMSFVAINTIFPALQRQICKDAGCDGVIDVWTALNGTSCTTLPPGVQKETPPCPDTPDGIHPHADTMAVVAQTIAKGIGAIN